MLSYSTARFRRPLTRRPAEPAGVPMPEPNDPPIGAEDETVHTIPPRSRQDLETDATALDDDRPVNVPEKIGHYKVKRLIAAGGMGAVYEAVQEQPRRTVALKIMKQGIASRSSLRRFEYESQILARLRHPGIAQVYEAGMHDDGTGGVPYFAMEYIAGAKDLIEFARAKEMRTRERLELFILVCDAVHHGHQKGIIHRDLKPANILVDSNGQPKIIDFGVARATDSDLAIPTLQTDVGQLVGTVQYMSPEQIDADPHDIDTRSDVYALGVVLYKLLTRKLPYDVSGTVIYEATRMIREETPKRVSSFNKTLRGDVETIILHALEKDRDRRYQSALELAQDIRRFLDNRTILARPPSVVYQCRTFVKRNKVLVGGIAAVFVALVLGMVGTTSQWKRADEQKVIAEAQRDLAQKRFDDVRQLGYTFITDIHDEIQDLDGTLEARKKLVNTALIYLDRLSADAGDDPLLRRELATAYDHVGDMHYSIRNPSLGDTKGALENFRKATQMREGLTEAFADDPSFLNEIASNHTRIGDVLRNTGRLAASLNEYKAGLAIREQLPDNTDYQRLLSFSLNGVGLVLARLGRLSEASEHYERSLDISKKLAARNAENPLFQRSLSVSYGRVGHIYYDGGDYRQALRRYQEQLRIREKLLAGDSTSTRFRRDVAVAHFYIARAHVNLDEPAEALGHGEHFLQVSKQGAAANPDDWRYTRDLAAAHEIVGRASLQMNDVDRARAHFEQYQAIIIPAWEKDPDNTQSRQHVAESHERMGDLHMHLGEHDRARSSYRESLAIWEELAAGDRDELQYRIERAKLTRKFGASVAGSDPAEAQFRLESALDEYEELRSGQPEHANIRQELAETYVELSTLMADLDDPAAALRFAEQAIATTDRQTPRMLYALSTARHLTGEPGGAVEAAELALQLIEQRRQNGRMTERLQQSLEKDLNIYRQELARRGG